MIWWATELAARHFPGNVMLKLAVGILVFGGTALLGLYVGLAIAVLPCGGEVVTAYCNAHGGGAIFTGLILGLIIGGVGGVWLARLVFRSMND
jgi:hypothetical protein